MKMGMKFRELVFLTYEERNIQRKEVQVIGLKTEGKRCVCGGGRLSDQKMSETSISVIGPNINILISPPRIIYILLTSMFDKNL